MFWRAHLTLGKASPINVRAQALSILSAAAPPPPLWRRTTDILPLCAAAKSLAETQKAHSVAIVYGLLPGSVSVAAALILSYATHHSQLSTLHTLFLQSLPFSRSPFLHNTLIRGCGVLSTWAHVDSIGNDGFLLYNDLMRNSLFRPDGHTFPFVLKLCADFLNIPKGLEVHGALIKSGFANDLFVNNILVLFYGNCGDLWNAQKLFDEMLERDLISWNTIIRVLSDKNCWLEAVGLFKHMLLMSGFWPNVVTVVSVLPVCAGLQDESLVGLVHCYTVKVGLDDELKVGNALVDAYGKSGNMEALEQVFDEMVQRNEVSWNSIIGGFAYRGFSIKALHSLREMIDEGLQLNTVTIATIIPTLVDLNLVKHGSELHGFSVKMDMDSDVFVANALIDMYGKCKRFIEASNMFYNMKKRNVVSWNSMIGNFAQNGLELDAIKFVIEMQVHGEIPNSVTLTNVLPACARVGSLSHGLEIHARSIRLGFIVQLFVSNALIDMYVKCNRLDLARVVFDVSLRDEVSYNILIIGYSQTCECSNSISLFKEIEMLGLKHDTISYMGVLSACANISAIKEGMQIHAFAMKRLFHEHLFIANSLLDLYIKCGQIHTARKVFDRILKKDAASWNTMILGYGMLGELNIAIDLFKDMEEDGIEYDAISYLAVLSACSHGGLVEKGKAYFDNMSAHNIEPTEMHYACMVDLLGRSGHMEEAVDLVNGLGVKQGANIWGALLGASRLHGSVELGCWAAEHLLELKPDHSGYYVLLSNMYAEAGRWEDADRIRNLMSKRRVMKNPGCSWVQIQDKLHGFIAGQRLDPRLLLRSSC